MGVHRNILLVMVLAAMVMAGLLGFGLYVSWWGTDYGRMLDAHLQWQRELAEITAAVTAPAAAGDWSEAAAGMRRLATDGAALVSGTPGELERAASLLAGGDTAGALALLREIAAREQDAERRLVERLLANQGRMQQGSLALAIVVPAVAVVFLLFLLRRVLAPLKDLGELLDAIARQDYHVVEEDEVHPLVQPLFTKYNRMVKRMQALDEGHVKRESLLRQDVDYATKALIQQQATMGRTERLAAMGEFSARLGHELRNPLSGVLMALVNLRSEMDSDDQDERLGLAITELERIAGLLSRIVDGVRQAPERPRRFCLRSVVDEVAGLLRYQLPDDVGLEIDVPVDLWCKLPEGGLRHVLLNLVLNSAQAMEEGGGTVRISARREDDSVSVTVSDDGRGFPEELLNSGIQEFGTWRADGTGIGLATVRRFAFASFGRVELANLPDGGARVTLRFPLAPGEEGSATKRKKRGD